MQDFDAVRVLELVQHHQVAAEWRVFPVSTWYFVRHGATYLYAVMLGIRGIRLIGDDVQHPVFVQDRGMPLC
jgi:hypothetical protein